MSSRPEILHAARKYLGVPFQHQGRTISGLDCLGLVIRVATDLDLAPGFADFAYDRFPAEPFVRAALDRHLARLRAPPQPGDIALIRWRRSANHLAIVSNAGLPFGLIHAYYVPGCVVEHRADLHWQDRIADLYSFRGVA